MVCYWFTERRIKNTFPHVLFVIQLCTRVPTGPVTGDKVQTLQIFDSTICDSDPELLASIPRQLREMPVTESIWQGFVEFVIASLVIPSKQQEPRVKNVCINTPPQIFLLMLTRIATKCTINSGLNNSTEQKRHRKGDGVHNAGFQRVAVSSNFKDQD